LGDPNDTRTPAMRRRDNAITMARYTTLGLIGLGVVIGLLGVGLLFTPVADDSPEIIAMAALVLVCGAGGFALTRSLGPSIAPDAWSPDVVNERIARMTYRNVIFVVFVSFWAIALAVFLFTTR
jgi:hypothetical protein